MLVIKVLPLLILFMISGSFEFNDNNISGSLRISELVEIDAPTSVYKLSGKKAPVPELDSI